MDNEIFNQKELKELRKKLRTNPTAPETLLWSKLKKGQLLGYKFRRQQGIGKYIADFYCPKAKLVIEIDGDSHYAGDEQEKDQKRDECLTNLGLLVIRFTNKEIMENISGVLEVIAKGVTTPSPSFKRRGDNT